MNPRRDLDESARLQALGAQALAQGNIPAAIRYCEQAIRLNDGSAAAYSNLGVAYFAVGQMDRAIFCQRRAIELAPENVAAYINLGNAFRVLKQFDNASACLRQLIAIKPACDAAYCDLGVVLQQQGRLDEAIACYRRAIELNPESVNALFNLGVALEATAALDEAVSCFRRVLLREPTLHDATRHLAKNLCDLGQFDEAIQCCRQILERAPGDANACNCLAVAMHRQGKLDAAAATLNQALALNPNSPEMQINLGSVLQDQGRLDDAAACYRRALAIQPEHADALSHLAAAQKDAGDVDAAIANYRRALRLSPDRHLISHQALFALHFSEQFDAAAIHLEHRQYDEQFAQPLAKFVQPHTNDPTPDRRLRIGYVSSEFCDHVLSLMTLPLLRNHDRERFEVFCYSDAPHRDELTAKFCELPHTWRDIVGRPDTEVARLIGEDRIDILIDLTMHMTRSHLLLFARKPAPIQVTWLGYPGTTGLSAIDYRLTDPYLDPPGLFDRFYAEKSVRLADTFWCYDALTTDVEVSPLPAEQNGYVTFGSLNNFCKTNATTFELWARVLNVVDHSRLLLLADEGSHRQRTLAIFAERGIAGDRITFVPRQPRQQYLRTYQCIDIGLDTLPYNGHVTSLDSFWMGVPVVSLVGQTVVGRAGLSQLSNLGLTELAAETANDFVQIAAKLADDRNRLSQLRSTLRTRMHASPLMDAPRFARNIEAAYRQMWETWCRGRVAT